MKDAKMLLLFVYFKNVGGEQMKVMRGREGGDASRMPLTAASPCYKCKPFMEILCR